VSDRLTLVGGISQSPGAPAAHLNRSLMRGRLHSHGCQAGYQIDTESGCHQHIAATAHLRPRASSVRYLCEQAAVTMTKATPRVEKSRVAVVAEGGGEVRDGTGL
jgi:hypothetical protein